MKSKTKRNETIKQLKRTITKQIKKTNQNKTKQKQTNKQKKRKQARPGRMDYIYILIDRSKLLNFIFCKPGIRNQHFESCFVSVNKQVEYDEAH